MDRPVAARSKPAHLICRTGWALLLTVGCGYLAYRCFSLVLASDYDWSHTWWNAVTWVVWACLAAGLLSEVRCWRERLFFLALLLQSLLGAAFSFWTGASVHLTQEARWLSLLLWLGATVLGFAVLFGGKRTQT